MYAVFFEIIVPQEDDDLQRSFKVIRDHMV